MSGFSRGRGGSGGAGKLNQLRDVNVGASPADNATLVYSTATAQWGAGSVVTGTTLSLQGLTNVSLSNPSNHQTLIFNGTSWSNGLIGSNNISAGAVDAAAIGTGAVTSGKILAGAVTANTIATNAVGSAAIAAGAVGHSELNVEAGVGNHAVGQQRRAGDCGGGGFRHAERDGAVQPRGGRSVVPHD